MIDNDKLLFLFNQMQKQESETAFSRLFDHCFPDLMRFAFSFVKSRGLSEEIASDVLFNFWKKKDKLKPTGDFKLYLYVSTRNSAFNHLRKKQNTPTLSLEDIAIWTKAHETNTPEVALITNELRLKINDSIQRLPTKCRLIYKLIKEDGLKYKEVASLLNLSQKTVEAQMGIAMKRLFIVFQHYLRSPVVKKELSNSSK